MAEPEAPLDVTRRIIDPHLHHWNIQAAPGGLQERQRFLLEEASETIAKSGHRVTDTIFVECHAMYREMGEPALRSLGETEFAAGIAARAASGAHGPCRFAHRIIGNVDLMLGEAAGELLDRHVTAAGPRFIGVRNNTAWSGVGLFGARCEGVAAERLRAPAFRRGLRALVDRALVLDVWCLHSQLDDLAALADAEPNAVIVLDHLGTPELAGRWGGGDPDVFAEWQRSITALASRPNLRVKIGGMGMALDHPIAASTGSTGSSQLATMWAPFAMTCIEAFGPGRCMFESNYPPDRTAASYGVIWNAFKRIAQGLSEDEKERLFHGTAAETYRIEPDA